MRKLHVLFAAALLVAVVVSPAVAAGGQEEGSGDEEVTLTYWHLWGGSRTELVDELITRFEKSHPNVTVEATFTPPNDLLTKVMQAAGTGTLPDVVQIHSGWYPQLQPSETLLALDEYVERDNLDLEKVLVEAEETRSYYDGTLYSLPNVNAGAQGLFFYNRDLMQEVGLDPDADAPQNWEEFVEVSKQLVEGLNSDGELNTIAWDPHQMAGQPMMIVFSYGAGHPTVSDDGTESLFDTAGVIETAERFDEYIEEVYGPYGGYEALINWYARVAGVDTGAAQVQGFAAGQQAFYVSGSWTISQVKSANAEMDFGILPVPGFDGQHGGIAKHGWSYAINKQTDVPDVAWEFLRFITLDINGNGWFTKQQLRPSPIAEVNLDPVYEEELGTMWNSLVESMNMDIVPESDIYQDVVKPWLRDFPSQRLQGKDVETIMNQIDRQFQDYLDDIYE